MKNHSEKEVLDEGLLPEFVGLSPFKAWERKRLKFNFGLVLACFVSFFLLYLVIYHFKNFSQTAPDTIYVTFYILFCIQLFLIITSNLLYFLGFISELVIKPKATEIYRKRLFKFGLYSFIILILSFPFCIYFF